MGATPLGAAHAVCGVAGWGFSRLLMPLAACEEGVINTWG